MLGPGSGLDQIDTLADQLVARVAMHLAGRRIAVQDLHRYDRVVRIEEHDAKRRLVPELSELGESEIERLLMPGDFPGGVAPDPGRVHDITEGEGSHECAGAGEPQQGMPADGTGREPDPSETAGEAN